MDQELLYHLEFQVVQFDLCHLYLHVNLLILYHPVDLVTSFAFSAFRTTFTLFTFVTFVTS